MTADQILAEIREANLSYLMLAQSLIRTDREQALFRLGVNGYMLPWDKLAQFVIVASFEWLDWLPGFGGTLVRNFIYTTSVNDRFFSLLAFMHIGIPLVVLLLMWIHVQRVPKAKTNPPRPIAIAVTSRNCARWSPRCRAR